MRELNRRTVLGGIAAGTIPTALAGCGGLLGGEQFAATPFGLPVETAREMGYTEGAYRRNSVEQEVPQTDNVTIVSHLVWYLTPESESPLPLAVLSTPEASVLGEARNPLANLSPEEILREVTSRPFLRQLVSSLELVPSDFAGWEQDPEAVREFTTTAFGDTETAGTLFLGQAQGAAILIALTRVTVADSVVVVASGRATALDTVEDTDPTGAFSEAETDALADEFTETLQRIEEIDPEGGIQDFGS